MEDTEKQNVSATGRDSKADPIEEIEAADMVNAADEFTEEQYNRVLRKVDWILLPLMWVSRT